jgi:hypothetical protein
VLDRDASGTLLEPGDNEGRPLTGMNRYMAAMARNRTPIRAGRSLGVRRVSSHLLIAALEAHVETLKAQLTAAEVRAEMLAADFAEREARHAAELAIERTLADHTSARVDQLTAELAAGRAMAERGLAAELARAWWKPLRRRR